MLCRGGDTVIDMCDGVHLKCVLNFVSARTCVCREAVSSEPQRATTAALAFTAPVLLLLFVSYLVSSVLLRLIVIANMSVCLFCP